MDYSLKKGINMNTRLGIISVAISLSLFTFSNANAVQTVSPAQSNQPAQALQLDPMIVVDQPQTKVNIAASLFIINSHEAVLSTQKNQGMLLTLQNVEPYATKFTGGPNRKATLTAIADVIQNWGQNKNDVATTKPTAALAGVPIMRNKKTPNYILELSNPVYDAKHSSLSFKAKWTGGTTAPENQMTLTNVSLVVDDGLQVALNAKFNKLGKSLLAKA